MVSFYPKRLSSIEKNHFFLLENNIEDKIKEQRPSVETTNSKNFNPIQSVTDHRRKINDRISEVSGLSQNSLAELQVEIPLPLKEKPKN